MNHRKSLINTGIFEKKFQASSHFELMEWDQVPEIIRNTLYELYDEMEVYGVFMPYNHSLYQPKVAYKEVALVYFHLVNHRSLPRYIKILKDPKIIETLIQLVLNDILLIENEGLYLGGTKSVKTLLGDYFGKEENSTGYINQLSLEAIRLAMALPETAFKVLSQKLYTYNTFSFQEEERVLDTPSFDAPSFVFRDISEPDQIKFNETWLRGHQSQNTAWVNFHRIPSSQTPIRKSNERNCKLYLSPLLIDLPKVFKEILTLLNSSRAFSFKFGSNRSGLIRPDKFVIYFNTYEEAFETGKVLAAALNGLEVQGVPFTYQIGDTGMVSLGMDPPIQEVIKEIEGGSWRAQVADILASSILHCKTKGMNLDSSLPYIRAQLYGHNIDPINWRPL